MTDHLSKADIIRFLERHLRVGKVTNPHAAKGRELPVKSWARAVGIEVHHLHNMKNGVEPIGRRHVAVLSRFIRDWENGMIEFGTGKQHRRFLIHRTTPKARAMQMSVDWRVGKLKIEPRPALNPRIPQFRDIFAGLKTR